MIVGEVLRTYKERFDPLLSAELQERLQRMTARLGAGTVLDNITQAVTIACAGGKRARPFLVETMYRTLGGSDDALITRAALATEIFHVFLFGTRRYY
jgi:geranylgeranyl pyrophosphate synthase